MHVHFVSLSVMSSMYVFIAVYVGVSHTLWSLPMIMIAAMEKQRQQNVNQAETRSVYHINAVIKVCHGIHFGVGVGTQRGFTATTHPTIRRQRLRGLAASASPFITDVALKATHAVQTTFVAARRCPWNEAMQRIQRHSQERGYQTRNPVIKSNLQSLSAYRCYTQSLQV